MDFFELLAFLLLLATGALWYSSLNVRELAVSEARAVCAAEGLLLLDDTVSIARIGLAPKADAGLRGKQRKRKGRASRREGALAKDAS